MALKPFRGNTQGPVPEFLREVYKWALTVAGDVASAVSDAAEAAADAAAALAVANTHATRHVDGGADEIAGEDIAVAFTPSNYTPSSGTLEGQLDGIDTALAGVGGDPPVAPLVWGAAYNGGTAATTNRNLFPGCVSTVAPANNGQATYNAWTVPYDATVKRFAGRIIPPTSSTAGETITLTLWRHDGASWATTGLSATVASNSSYTENVNGGTVDVDAGDMLAVIITYSGTISATTGGATQASCYLEKR